uniref:Endonuclease/exonuclease/phosphatase domain-containing protein n=1 Tax=Cannabis sativa TaxID=3483 RepID=A0A803NRP7_CANSA
MNGNLLLVHIAKELDILPWIVGKKEGKKAEWVVKKQAGKNQAAGEVTGEDGFMPTEKIWKEKIKEKQAASVVAVASFHVTFTYAFNDGEGRKKLWQDLQELATVKTWIVIGDFNDILAKEERIGKPVSASYFTWTNKQHGEDRIYYKIDRALANQVWLGDHPTTEVVFMNESVFDHTPSVLNFHNKIVSGRKSFKYFKMWENHLNYADIVQQTWQQHFNVTKMFCIVSKLKSMKTSLKVLNTQHFTDIQAKEAQARVQLDDCQNLL